MTAADQVGGSSPLCLGQVAAWTAGRQLRGQWRKLLNFSAVWPVPDGVSRAAVRRALNTLTERHETLRTHYVEDESPQGARQVVLPVPQLDVAVLEVDSDTWATDELMMRAPKSIIEFLDCCFTIIDDDLNWKAAIAEMDGRPRFVCFVCHHIVADMTGVVTLGDELTAILDGTDPGETAGTRMQPRALAEIERSRLARGAGGASLAYMRSILNEIPDGASWSVDPADVDEQARAIRRVQLKTALELSRVTRLASSNKVSVSSLVLALMLAGLARSRPEVPAIPVSIVSWNRFTPQLQSMVGTVSLRAPILVAVPPQLEFGELAQRVHRAALTAYRHASYDCTEIVRETEAIAAARNVPLDVPYGFAAQLDRRVHRPKARDTPRTADELVRLPPLGLSDEQRRFPPIHEVVVRADAYLDLWLSADVVIEPMASAVLRTIREGLGILLESDGASMPVRELYKRVDDAETEPYLLGPTPTLTMHAG